MRNHHVYHTGMYDSWSDHMKVQLSDLLCNNTDNKHMHEEWQIPIVVLIFGTRISRYHLGFSYSIYRRYSSCFNECDINTQIHGKIPMLGVKAIKTWPWIQTLFLVQMAYTDGAVLVTISWKKIKTLSGNIPWNSTKWPKQWVERKCYALGSM